jgi:uncharacterized membrane protein YccC
MNENIDRWLDRKLAYYQNIMSTPETKWTPAALASAQRNPDALAVRSASLRNLAVNMNADPDVLHDAADMLYDASQELEHLRREIAAMREALRDIIAHHVEQNRIKGRPETESTTLRIARTALSGGIK